jgi:hypothetical protein
MEESERYEVEGKIRKVTPEKKDGDAFGTIVGFFIVLGILYACVKGCENSHGAVVTTPPAASAEGR